MYVVDSSWAFLVFGPQDSVDSNPAFMDKALTAGPMNADYLSKERKTTHFWDSLSGIKIKQPERVNPKI